MQATEWTGFKITVTKLSGPKLEKKIDRAGLGSKFKFPFQAGLGPKFQFLFRARLGPGRNFFSLLRAGLGRYCSHAGQAWSEKSSLCRPLVSIAPNFL